MTYLGQPYSHKEAEVRQWRFEQACIHAGHLMKQGFVIYSPIAHSHPIAESCEMPTDFAFWQKHCLEVLGRCDQMTILKLEGWELSVGLKAEMDYAMKHGIPIAYMEPLA